MGTKRAESGADEIKTRSLKNQRLRHPAGIFLQTVFLVNVEGKELIGLVGISWDIIPFG